MESWRTRTLIAGAVIGALAGLAAGYVLVQRAEEMNEAPKLSAGDGVKLGLGVLGLLRLVSDFSKA
jgi:hypothetical protein